MENYIEWIGYLASFIILVSLLMRSIKRLRIINMIGAGIFAFYGYQIGSAPVMIMNLGIFLINVYYLKQIYASSDYFKILPVYENEEYVRALIDFYRTDIERFMEIKDGLLQDSQFRFLVLRNMNPAGIFVARPYDEETLEITLDYATPQFQDFKTGAHIYDRQRNLFQEAGYKKFIVESKSESHRNYLNKMGFKETTINNKNTFIKNI